MKKLILLLLMVIQFECIVAQNLLDERNGFKSIKLNSPKEQFSGISFQRQEEEFEVYSFSSNNSDDFYVFDYKMDKIDLFFDKSTNLLKKIDIVKVFCTVDNKESIEFTTSIHNKYIAILGKANEIVNINNTKKREIGLNWFSSNVALSVTTVGLPGVLQFVDTKFM
jgi:hypothetical protein